MSGSSEEGIKCTVIGDKYIRLSVPDTDGRAKLSSLEGQ